MNAEQIVQLAAASIGVGVVDAAVDPLDGSVWLRLSGEREASRGAELLLDLGLAVQERSECRVQVTGWDARLLRRRLGVLLAGVDDLREEWDATGELVRFHHDRRSAATGRPPDPVEVLADVERAMRDARPLPHRAPNTDDVDSLLQLVEAAQDAYAQLIEQHLEHAAAVLAAYTAGTTGSRS